MQALMVNPRRRRRRRRRTRRRRSYRRRNPGTLRVVNPRPRGFGNIMPMVTDAVQISLGAVIGRVIPARFMPTLAATPNTKAIASVVIGMMIAGVGRGMLGAKIAQNLGIGAIVGGVGPLIENILPAGFKGMGQEIPLTPAEIDEEFQSILSGGVGGLGFAEEAEVGTVDPAFA